MSPAPSNTQRKFILDGERPVLALATVNHARSLLPGHDEDDIKALWEDGSLLYAWDISLRPEKTIDARILPSCIEHYRRSAAVSSSTSRSANKSEVASESEVERDLLFNLGNKTFTTSRRLALVFNCSSTHILNLILAKQLTKLPHTTWGTGPNGAALVTIDSVKKFLAARRLP